MRVLVVSDTHKNLALFQKVLNLHKFDLLFHLGDYYEDSIRVDFKQYCKTLYRVPGIFNEDYIRGNLDAVDIVDISNISIYLVHAIQDIRFSKVKNSLVFYGHTHIMNVEEYNSNILINPGHLKNNTDRGQNASYMILDVEENSIEIECYEVKLGLLKKYKIIIENDKLELKHVG